jgi:hypothetical protein
MRCAYPYILREGWVPKMPMDMIEFQTALTMVNQGLGKTRERLGSALNDEELSDDERREYLAAGERKLAEFDALLMQVDDDMREIALEGSGAEIAKIRDRVTRLQERL